jgi:catechol 2,3-dioxygenase-like lactoylglutathione lyase family enzyme
LLGGLRHDLLRAVIIVQIAALLPMAASLAWAQSASVPRSSSASIRTPDFDESVRWYQDKLGFRLIASQSLVSGRTAVLERSGFLVEIAEADHPPVSAQEGGQGEGSVTRHPVISLLVPDVDEEVARLRKKGVEILQDPEDELGGTYRTAQIRDNGRHRIELREPLGEEGFNPTGR